MLTESELASMRAHLDLSLAGTAVISTAAWVSDGGGGGTTTYTPAGTVDCRIAPAPSAEAVTGARLQPDTEVMITVPRGTTIDHDARVTHDGVTYAVTALRAPRTWEISRRVEAKVIE